MKTLGLTNLSFSSYLPLCYIVPYDHRFIYLLVKWHSRGTRFGEIERAYGFRWRMEIDEKYFVTESRRGDLLSVFEMILSTVKMKHN